jgi:protein-tyrosine phosphatase
MAHPTPAILFVCLGNICRSPLAEAAFRARAAAAGLSAAADSAGTGSWHIGEPPDRRAQTTALRHGADISRYRGRQVEPADFHRFTHIFALDHDNLANLTRLAPADGTARLGLLLDLVENLKGQAVADPYYGAEDGFEVTWTQVDAAAQALVTRLMHEPG